MGPKTMKRVKTEQLIQRLESDHKSTVEDMQFMFHAVASMRVAVTEIPRQTLLQYFYHASALRKGSKSLPFTVLLAAVFMSAVFLHERVEHVHSVEFYLTNELTTQGDVTFEDIQTVEDVWGWILGVYVPTVWTNTTASQESLAYTTPVASIQFLQRRAKGTTCDTLGSFYGVCYEAGANSKEPFGDSADSGLEGFEFDADLDAFGIEVESTTPTTSVLDILVDHRSNGWLDDATLELEIRAAQQNAEFSLITASVVTIEFKRGGAISPSIRLHTIHADWYIEWYLYFCDILWLVMVVGICFGEALDYQRHRQRGLTSVYWSDRWNVFDWVEVLYSVALVGYWAVILVYTGDLRDKMSALLDGQSTAQYRAVVNDTHSLARLYVTFRVCVAGHIILLILRFFKAFHSQPRLAVVTYTFTAASSDLVHFLIVVVTVWLCFVTSGMALFGPGVEAYTAFQPASTACLQILLGETGVWDEINAHDPQTTMVWFYSFFITILLVLANILVAIIIDKYLFVKSTFGKDAPSLWNQLVTTWSTILRGDTQINRLVTKMERGELKHSEVIGVKDLQRHGRMNELAALQLIRSVKQWEVAKAKNRGVSLTDALREVPVISEAFNGVFFRLRQAATHMREQNAQILQIHAQMRDLVIKAGGKAMLRRALRKSQRMSSRPAVRKQSTSK